MVLPTLRMQARLKRVELVNRLADALGLAGREEKIGRYYNAMEHEQLDPSGISPRVLEALAGIVRTTADALWRAAPGSAVPPVADAPARAFARQAPWDSDADAVAASPGQSPDLDWDEVDELFTGG